MVLNFFLALKKYQDALHGPAKDYPRRKVTRQEFILLMMATGTSKKAAELQATVSQSIGSNILIGDEWVGVMSK